MNLPSNIIAAGKATLQANWNDTVTVIRKGDKKVGNSYPTVTAYQDIKCHLSQSNMPVTNQTTTVATTDAVYTLFVDTSVQLEASDTVVILHKGQTIKGILGKPFNRDFSNAAKVGSIEIS